MKFLKNNMLMVICGIGIFQAIAVNILKIGIPFLTFFCIIYLIFNYFGKTDANLSSLKFNYQFYILVLSLILLYVFALMRSWENKSDIAYHLNVIVALIFGKTIAKDPDVEFKLPIRMLWGYMILSFLIYFFAWEQVAGLTYSYDGYLGMRTNGFNRLFGLLFNPLANAYFLLLLFFLTYAIHEKQLGLFKMALIFSVLMAITRGAMVSLALFFTLYLFYRKKWIVILLCILLVVAIYVTVEPVKIIIDSIITMEDSQGSAQGHEESLRTAVQTIISHPLGVGFSNIHAESWIFNYGLYYGYPGIVVLLSFFSYIGIKLLLKRKLFYFLLFISFLPITLIIPFHTFNLPIILFFIFTYYLYYRRPEHEYRL